MRGRERGVVAKGEVVAFRLAVREALDQRPGAVARDGPVGAVLDGALRCGFGGFAKGWLTLLTCVSQLTLHTHTDSHRPVFFEFTGFRGPIPSV